jgi:transmembrane sensor
MWCVGSVRARENGLRDRKQDFLVMAAIDQTGSRQREAHEWLARLTSGQATVADAEAAKLWCSQSPDHARAFAEATLLWDTLEPVARKLAGQGAGAMLAERQSSLGSRVGRRALLGGAIAASAVAATYLAARPPFELWPSFSDMAADYRTGTGERRSVAIDGIAVELNTRSSLNVLAGNGASRRLELVAGEAVFATGDVQAAPFVLVVGGGQVSAAAAKFDVRCDSTDVSVTCLQGAIEVNYRGARTTLQERQQIVFGASGLGSATVIDPTVATAWRDGRLVFHGIPLSQVVDEVNRYRPGRIILMNAALGRRPVEATLPLDRIDELMVLLRNVYGVAIKTLPGGIVILT